MRAEYASDVGLGRENLTAAILAGLEIDVVGPAAFAAVLVFHIGRTRKAVVRLAIALLHTGYFFPGYGHFKSPVVSGARFVNTQDGPFEGAKWSIRPDVVCYGPGTANATAKPSAPGRTRPARTLGMSGAIARVYTHNPGTAPALLSTDASQLPFGSLRPPS